MVRMASDIILHKSASSWGAVRHGVIRLLKSALSGICSLASFLQHHASKKTGWKLVVASWSPLSDTNANGTGVSFVSYTKSCTTCPFSNFVQFWRYNAFRRIYSTTRQRSLMPTDLLYGVCLLRQVPWRDERALWTGGMFHSSLAPSRSMAPC
ncbi:hypothetical protein MPH_01150 [Macrophomina phaseolina MS6]|uniref:Uncharacterized protein n=1 Tax=Macrophomina phaseolina (strain MS6) TaxID=1126212 RepID=K2RGB1_MACPH|nr:hypothetical protein MPH_01150 [Macrophomina phaseolina MS6]